MTDVFGNYVIQKVYLASFFSLYADSSVINMLFLFGLLEFHTLSLQYYSFLSTVLIVKERNWPTNLQVMFYLLVCKCMVAE
jgi:hypothetical protein